MVYYNYGCPDLCWIPTRKEEVMTVIAQYLKFDGKIYVYHDIKSITYNAAGFAALKKRDTVIDLNENYKIIAIVD